MNRLTWIVRNVTMIRFHNGNLPLYEMLSSSVRSVRTSPSSDSSAIRLSPMTLLVSHSPSINCNTKNTHPNTPVSIPIFKLASCPLYSVSSHPYPEQPHRTGKNSLYPHHINQSINHLHRRRHCVPLCPYHTSYYTVDINFNYTLITVLRYVSDSSQCGLIQ